MAASSPPGCPLPYSVRNQLDTPPLAGGGVHIWLFCMARYLHPFLPADKIIAVLQSRVADCGRVVPLREIEEAVRNSGGCAWTPGKKRMPGHVAAPTWPAVNKELSVRSNQRLCRSDRSDRSGRSLRRLSESGREGVVSPRVGYRSGTAPRTLGPGVGLLIAVGQVMWPSKLVDPQAAFYSDGGELHRHRQPTCVRNSCAT